MSIQFIRPNRTAGWQARVYTTYPKYLSVFFAVATYGEEEAKRMAENAERRLKRQQERLRLEEKRQRRRQLRIIRLQREGKR